MGRARALIAAVLCAASAAADERGDAHASLGVYVQPASAASLLVITPTVDGRAFVRDWLRVDVTWTADVVTGATFRTYARPDVVSAATRFTEVRNTLGAGAEARVGPAAFSAGYAFGTENDYRSHLLRGGARVDLFEHNTVVAAHYDHSFNFVCNYDQTGVPLLERPPLDNSRACFSGAPGLTDETLDIDSAELSLTQTLTPSLVGTLVGSYQHLSGFQSNPYRQVRLDGGRFLPQESHPRLRDRGALTARVRWAIERVRATLGGDVRLYRDTWGVQSITGESSWEQRFGRESHWRYALRLRGYAQSRALFYRDAGEADSYENAGPVGSYFTADQELAPLADLFVGGRLTWTPARPGPGERRLARMFTDFELSILLDYVKIFALSPEPPENARISGFASVIMLGVSATGKF